MSTSFGRALRTLFVSLIYVSAYFLMQNIAAMVLGLTAMYFDRSANPITVFDRAVSQNIYLCVIGSMLAVFAVYAAFGVLRERPLFGELRLSRASEAVAVPAVFVAIGCRIAVEVYTAVAKNIPVLRNSLEQSNDYTAALSTPFGFAMFVLTIVFLGPIFEEILFRGLVQTELMRGFPPAMAIIVGALIFGAGHGMLFQSLFAFFVGLVLGWVYYVTNNLFVTMIIHIVFNASSFVTVFSLTLAPWAMILFGVLSAVLVISSCVLIYLRSRA